MVDPVLLPLFFEEAGDISDSNLKLFQITVIPHTSARIVLASGLSERL